MRLVAFGGNLSQRFMRDGQDSTLPLVFHISLQINLTFLLLQPSQAQHTEC